MSNYFTLSLDPVPFTVQARRVRDANSKILIVQARLVRDENELGLHLDSLALVEILLKITEVSKR